METFLLIMFYSVLVMVGLTTLAAAFVGLAKLMTDVAGEPEAH